jgi:hypothetical protein
MNSEEAINGKINILERIKVEIFYVFHFVLEERRRSERDAN